MLVLSRKIQETIRIGDDITISILRFKGRAVSVGIEAPSDVRVMRGELAGPDRFPGGSGTSKGEAEADDSPQDDSLGKRLAPRPLVSQRLSTRRVNEILASQLRASRCAIKRPSVVVAAS
jgi:carbon storage regulator CsrA